MVDGNDAAVRGVLALSIRGSRNGAKRSFVRFSPAAAAVGAFRISVRDPASEAADRERHQGCEGGDIASAPQLRNRLPPTG